MGTPAITTRGVKEDVIPKMVELIDRVIMNIDDRQIIEEVRINVNELMANYPMFA